jgi:hypothetical protein
VLAKRPSQSLQPLVLENLHEGPNTMGAELAWIAMAYAFGTIVAR